MTHNILLTCPPMIKQISRYGDLLDKYNFKITIFFFFITYFFLGTIIYNDYGIGIEEHFQRQNGFYWLNYFISNTNLESLKSIIDLKYKEILQTNPYLPETNIFNF